MISGQRISAFLPGVWIATSIALAPALQAQVRDSGRTSATLRLNQLASDSLDTSQLQAALVLADSLERTGPSVAVYLGRT